MFRNSHLPVVVLIAIGVVGTALLSFGDDDAPTAETEAESTTSAPATTTPGVQFEADFSSAAGASLTTTNGGSPQREGDLEGMYAAYGSVPEGQSDVLTLRVTEDNSVNGPDDRPGVLRMQYVDVPPTTKYSGFLITGNQEHGKMQIPGWTPGEVTMADLRRTFIEFRFRADNPSNPADFGGMYSFRIEPGLPDSFALRSDFGALIATGRWRTFRRPIGSGKNLEEFLRAVNEENPPNFKLVWSQAGSISRYTAGDSLLIDDLRIVIE